MSAHLLSPSTHNRLGLYLKDLRSTRGLSLREAAETAHLGRRTVQRWESGQFLPRLAELNALLGALSASVPERQRALEFLEAPRSLRVVRRADPGEPDGGALPCGGDLLRALRHRRGWTQEQVAGRLGVAQTTVARWERSEAWPALGTLHSLCTVLGAYEEELNALTMGRFSLAGAGGVGEPSLDQLRDRAQFLLRPPASAREHALKDLHYLVLEAEAGTLAARYVAGRSLLVDVYLQHANYLFSQLRDAEMEFCARRALRLAEGESVDQVIRGVIHVAEALARPRTAYGYDSALRQLQPWLHAAMTPQCRAWLWTLVGCFLNSLGRHDEAVWYAREGYERAVREIGPDPCRRERNNLAGIYEAAGRPQEALRLLQVGADETPSLIAHARLTQARAYKQLGERSAAASLAAQVRVDMVAYGLHYVLQDLEQLETQL